MRLSVVLTVTLSLVLFGAFYLTRHSFPQHSQPPKTPQQTPAVAAVAKPGSPELPDGLGEVKIVGPLANWMAAEQAAHPEPDPDAAPAAPSSRHEIDRLVLNDTPEPDRLIHATFPVKTYTAFKIQLPPGTIAATLGGRFESFTFGAGHRRHPEKVQLLLLDEQQVQDFARGDTASATDVIEATTSQTVKWSLRPDYHQLKQYYLVFSNPDGGKTKLVKADFTVEYD